MKLKKSTAQYSLFILILSLGTGCTEYRDGSEIENVVSSVREARAAESFLASQFHADEPGGVVLVASAGQIILHAAYGMSNMAAGREMNVDQVLPIGSLTKSFTAAAILRLVQSGQLSLDDDVRMYVPGAPVNGHSVTIEQLLTHTSGMPNLVDNPDFFTWAQKKRGTSELLAQTEQTPFVFAPGTGFAYSDSGYILLGAVLEVIETGSWSDAVRKWVTRPLGLASVRPAAHWNDHFVVGYRYDDGRFNVAETIDWSVPHASGALVASVDDLLTWIQAWHSADFIRPEIQHRAWAARTLPDGTFSGYGYGWKNCDFEGRTAIQHGGYIPGFTASVLHLPDDGLTAIALLNSEGRLEAGYLTRRVLRLLLTGKPEISPYVLTATERRRLEGRYRSAHGSTWTVQMENGNPVLTLAENRVDLVALTATKLCAADSDGTWCFTFDADEGGPAAAVAMSLTCEPQSRAIRVGQDD